MQAAWVPQQDVLAHPNTRLLLSHGGLASLTESIYHQTPLLGIPASNDQKQNMARAVRQGYARSTDWAGLSQAALLAAVRAALGDEAMLARLGQVRQVYTDTGHSPRAQVSPTPRPCRTCRTGGLVGRVRLPARWGALAAASRGAGGGLLHPAAPPGHPGVPGSSVLPSPAPAYPAVQGPMEDGVWQKSKD